MKIEAVGIRRGEYVSNNVCMYGWSLTRGKWRKDEYKHGEFKDAVKEDNQRSILSITSILHYLAIEVVDWYLQKLSTTFWVAYGNRNSHYVFLHQVGR